VEKSAFSRRTRKRWKKLMATVRGCKPWEVADMNTLTDEEIDTNLREAGAVIMFNYQEVS
jgi:hypothetical protein